MKQILLNVVLLPMVGLFLTADVEAAGNAITGTCEVTSANNDGSGTLRDCLLGALQGDVITFDTTVFPFASPTTILLTTELPALISGTVTINACDAGVILDGDNAVDNGLTIQSDDNLILGLEIKRFSMYGIYIEGSDNRIGGGDDCGGINHWNLVTGCDTGIAISGSGSGDNSIIANFVEGSRIGVRIDPQDPQVHFQRVRDNTIGGGFHSFPPNGNDIGILVASGWDHRIVDNRIGYNGIGIRVEGDATLHSVGDGSPNNCFISNTIGFSHAGTAIDLRIETNWWNAANGPSGVGPGDGDSIEEVGTGTVDYEPWLTSPECSACLPCGIFADGFESGEQPRMAEQPLQCT